MMTSSIDVAPAWFIYSMHFTAAATTPVNLIGVVILLFCQKRQVQSLRWHLLTYQTCSMITDFLINIGSLPVIFSPFPIGRPHGLFTAMLSSFGVGLNTKVQCQVVIGAIFVTAGSVELLFFLRYQTILPSNHRHKLSVTTSVVLLSFYQVLWLSFMLIFFHAAIPDQRTARNLFAKLYPEYTYLIEDEHVFFICVEVQPIHALFLSTCFMRLGAGMLTVCILIWMSSRALHSFQLSTRTRRMHLELIRNLCYQIVIPIMAFYGPILVFLIPLMFFIPNTQGIYCTSLIFMSLHTCLGTLSMLYFNRPYRRWLLLAIRKRTLTTSFSEKSKTQFDKRMACSRINGLKTSVSVVF